MRFQITRGTIHVFTYKEGMLSAVAHDLRLTLRRFRINVDGENVAGEFFPETLHVDGAVRDGALDARALSDRDRDKIRATMAGEVLRISQFAKVAFVGTARADGAQVLAKGTLELVGKRQELELAMRRESGDSGEVLRGEIELQPSRWGIRPYSALAGTLRLQDRVRVEFELTR
ncbi:MAG: YceI family protein [Myxococcales bacterium]|nr:YceI family protein [Myxococcales bacterium]